MILKIIIIKFNKFTLQTVKKRKKKYGTNIQAINVNIIFRV